MSDYVTKQDLDKALKTHTNEIVEVIHTFMGHVDERFNGIEGRLIKLESAVKENTKAIIKLQKDVQTILNRLDSIEGDIQLNEQERAVMGMQLTRLHDWVEKTAAKVGVEFVH